MFIQSCYIKLNTKELRDALKNMGYNCDFIRDTNKDPNKAKYIQCVNEAINGKAVDFYENPNKGIDCGTNQELFLALAALQDDNDKNQWFFKTDDDGETLVHLCSSNKIEDDTFYGDEELSFCIEDYSDYHKASVEELINYFK